MMRFELPSRETLFKILIWIQLVSSVVLLPALIPFLNLSLGDISYSTPSCPEGRTLNYGADYPSEQCEDEFEEMYHASLLTVWVFSSGVVMVISSSMIGLPGFFLWGQNKLNAAESRIFRLNVLLFWGTVGLCISLNVLFLII